MLVINFNPPPQRCWSSGQLVALVQQGPNKLLARSRAGRLTIGAFQTLETARVYDLAEVFREVG